MVQFKHTTVGDWATESISRRRLSGSRCRLVSCIFNSAEERCIALGREPSLAEALLQLRIRIFATGKLSGRTQLSTMRKLFSCMHSTRQVAEEAGLWISPREAAPTGVEFPDWFDEDWQAVEEESTHLHRKTQSSLKRQAQGELSAIIKEFQQLGDLGSEADIVAQAVGVQMGVSDTRRPPQRRWEFICANMLNRLLERFPRSKTNSPFSGLMKGKSANPDLAKLLATVTWLTGMRFCEVFNFKLMRPTPDADVDSIRASPLQAAENGQLQDYLESSAHRSEANLPPSNEAVSILIIKTAKAGLASPGIDNRKRALILDGIEPQMLVPLAVASSLRLFDINETQLHRIRNYTSCTMNRASKIVFPSRSDPLTLHSMRHAFADVARATLDPAAAAALTGHTATSTLRGYGRKRNSRTGSKQPSRWMPEPDGERVELLKSVWQARQKPMPFSKRLNELEPPQPGNNSTESELYS